MKVRQKAREKPKKKQKPQTLFHSPAEAFTFDKVVLCQHGFVRQLERSYVWLKHGFFCFLSVFPQIFFSQRNATPKPPSHRSGRPKARISPRKMSVGRSKA
jgi:hypothetical protein